MEQVQAILTEMKAVREEIQKADHARNDAIEELKKSLGVTSTDVEAKLGRIAADITANATKHQELETTLNDIIKRISKPSFSEEDQRQEKARQAGYDLLQMKHQLTIAKKDATVVFNPSHEAIDEAVVAIKGIRSLMNTTNIDRLPEDQRKALGAFSFGSNGFIMPPEMSSTVLSCLEDETDITGLVSSMTISGPSVRFLVDNVRIDTAAWACEASCFANNPQIDLQSGLGEMEIKPETLRYIVCATRDLLEDASTDIEGWMLGKVNDAFRRTIGNAILTGTGAGMPLGILDPSAGFIACDTAEPTPVGQFTWQDLVMLKWTVAAQFHAGASYLMNQDTFGKTLTMSDANGRPIMLPIPGIGTGTFSINGSPVNIVTSFPNVTPGALPVAFGNWSRAYMLVNRKAVTMQQDPYSASFCLLYKWEARVGGGVVCTNAARFLRIR